MGSFALTRNSCEVTGTLTLNSMTEEPKGGEMSPENIVLTVMPKAGGSSQTIDLVFESSGGSGGTTNYTFKADLTELDVSGDYRLSATGEYYTKTPGANSDSLSNQTLSCGMGGP